MSLLSWCLCPHRALGSGSKCSGLAFLMGSQYGSMWSLKLCVSRSCTKHSLHRISCHSHSNSAMRVLLENSLGMRNLKDSRFGDWTVFYSQSIAGSALLIYAQTPGQLPSASPLVPHAALRDNCRKGWAELGWLEILGGLGSGLQGPNSTCEFQPFSSRATQEQSGIVGGFLSIGS